MKKYYWNYKKFFKNIACLFFYIIYIILIYVIFSNFEKSPTCQYKEYIEKGGNWQDWSYLLQERGEK